MHTCNLQMKIGYLNASKRLSSLQCVTLFKLECCVLDMCPPGPQLGMTTIIGIATAGAVLISVVIFVLIIIAICCIRARTKKISGSMDFGGGSPSTKKKSPPQHRKPTNGESISLSSEVQMVYVREPRAVGSPPPSSLETSSSNLNVAYTHELRAAGSHSPPPVSTDPATSITFGK